MKRLLDMDKRYISVLLCFSLLFLSMLCLVHEPVAAQEHSHGQAGENRSAPHGEHDAGQSPGHSELSCCTDTSVSLERVVLRLPGKLYLLSSVDFFRAATQPEDHSLRYAVSPERSLFSMEDIPVESEPLFYVSDSINAPPIG